MANRKPISELAESTQNAFIKQVSDNHREMARMSSLGIKPGQIAKYFGVTPARVSVIRSSPLFIAELEKLHALRDQGTGDVRATLDKLSEPAVDTLARAMYNGETEKNKMDAANSILDRAGFGKSTTSNVNVHAQVNTSRLTHNEMVDLVMKRVNKVETRAQEEAAMLERAKHVTVEVELEDVPEERSHAEPKNENYGYGKSD